MVPLLADEGRSSHFEGDSNTRAGAVSPISESLGRQLAKRRVAHRLASGQSTPTEQIDRRQQQLHAFLGQQERDAATGSPAGDAGPGRDRHTSRRSSFSSNTTTTNANVNKHGKLGLTHPKAIAAVAPSHTSAVGEISEPGDGRASPGLVAASKAPDPRDEKRQAATALTQEDGGNMLYSSYDGSDPHLRAHLLMWYTQRAHTRVPVSSARKAGGLLAVRAQRFRKAARSAVGANRKPEGNMIAYFNEHAAAVTVLVAALDHAFFVSGSTDGTLRIWDTARLEKNVTSRSRGVYAGHNGAITACVALRSDSRCMASASRDGSVHIWRVDVTFNNGGMPRYQRPRLMSHFQFSRPGEFATTLLETVHDGAAALVLGTSHGQLTVVDLRTMQVLQSLRNPPYLGAVTAMCSDSARQGHSNWLVVAMSNGCAVLWDLRFSLAINSWRIIRFEDISHWRVVQLANHPRPDLPNVIIAALGCSDRPQVPATPLSTSGQTQSPSNPFAYQNPAHAFRHHTGNENVPIGDHTSFSSANYPMVQFWDIHDPSAPIATFESHESQTASNESSARSSMPSQSLARPSSKTATQPKHNVRHDPPAYWPPPLQAPAEEGLVGNLSSAQAIEALLSSPSTLEDSATYQTTVETSASGTGNETPRGTNGNGSPDGIGEQENGLEFPADAWAVLASTEGYRSTNLTSNKWDDWVDAGAAIVQPPASDGIPDEAAGSADHGGMLMAHSKAQSGMAQLTRPTKGVSGWMITAGSDRRIRMWDLGRAEKSMVVAGLPGEGAGTGSFAFRPPSPPAHAPNGPFFEGSAGVEGTHTDGEPQPRRPRSLDFTHVLSPSAPSDARRRGAPLLGPGQTKHAHGHESMRTHRAAITALCMLELPFRCIVAGDRSGRIMVWE